MHRNGDSTGEEIGFPNFILKKARISVHLQLQLNSLRTRVVSLEPWILQTMVWAIITWETSTMVPLSCASQGRIFHRHVRLDIWRCRSTRIHVRFHLPHRKTTNSNGNQGPSTGHSESTFCSSVTKVVEFILLQTSHSPLTITAETLWLSITGEKHTVASWQHIVTLSCPTSLHPCCVVRCFERSLMQFRKKMVRNP